MLMRCTRPSTARITRGCGGPPALMILAQPDVNAPDVDLLQARNPARARNRGRYGRERYGSRTARGVVWPETRPRRPHAGSVCPWGLRIETQNSSLSLCLSLCVPFITRRQETSPGRRIELKHLIAHARPPQKCRPKVHAPSNPQPHRPRVRGAGRRPGAALGEECAPLLGKSGSGDWEGARGGRPRSLSQ